ncbi:hypothetical protein MIMGU_mgv1a022599mg, partial [Erythranthe guttata]
MYGYQWGGGGGDSGSELPPTLDRTEKAAVEARAELVARGENVSAWKVSQAALLDLQVSSWEFLGFSMQQVPTLRRIMDIEGRVNLFIHCFVRVQSITSLYNLELAICESEGIQRFEELELGPLLQHPLVRRYFSVGSDVKEVFRITTETVISYLSFLIWKRKRITPEALLDFISKEKKQEKETLCLRIQNICKLEFIDDSEHMMFFISGSCRYRDDDENEDSKDVPISSKTSSKNMETDKNNAQCSDPTTAEEDERVSSLSSRGNISINDNNVTAKKSKRMQCTVTSFHKTPITMPDGREIPLEFFGDGMDSGLRYMNDVDRFTRMFIKIWTDTCRDKNVDE